MTNEQISITIIICVITIVTIIFGVAIVELQLGMDRLAKLVDKLEEKLNKND